MFPRTIFASDPRAGRPARATQSKPADPTRLTVMKLPGPDHPITITPNPKRVRVSIAGLVIAETKRALTLNEAKYPSVQYVPREDANLALMERSGRVTHCPSQLAAK